MTASKPEVIAYLWWVRGLCAFVYPAYAEQLMDDGEHAEPIIRLTDHETARAADKARIAELEGVLADATQEVEEWGAYASEYFQEKHDLAGTVARFRAALSQQGKEGET